jgi:hypothetical protein
MELVDRYVLEVRRHLPREIRDDVAREIGSSIDDAIDARAKKTGCTPDQAASEVLKEFGPPKEIADSYISPGLCLIGPRLFRPYLRTLKITIIGTYSIMIAFILTYLISGNVGPDLFLKTVISATGRFPFRALFIFGLVTAIFALVERFGSPHGATEKEWDPENLPPLAGRKEVNRAGLIIHSFILVGLLLLFNFAWQWIGVMNNYDGQWIFVPIAGGGFLRMLIWIDFYMILALALNIILLRSDRWHIAARVFRLALTVILGILLYRLAMTPGLTGMHPGWYAGPIVPREYPELFETTLYPLIAGAVKTLLLVAIIPVTVSAVHQAASLVRNR